jgi:hypothetical protein
VFTRTSRSTIQIHSLRKQGSSLHEYRRLEFFHSKSLMRAEACYTGRKHWKQPRRQNRAWYVSTRPVDRVTLKKLTHCTAHVDRKVGVKRKQPFLQSNCVQEVKIERTGLLEGPLNQMATCPWTELSGCVKIHSKGQSHHLTNFSFCFSLSF